MENVIFKCIEYKKDGNTTKIVRRELLPGEGCNSLYYCGYSDDFGNWSRDYFKVYKTANGYAVEVCNRINDIKQLNADAVQMCDDYNIIELVKRGGIFAGRAVIEFVRLSGTVEELREVVRIREEFDKKQQREKEEEERARIAREEEERKKEEQRREALMIEAVNTFIAGGVNNWVSVEAVELLAVEYGVKIHPRTVGAMRENVAKVRADGDVLPRKMKTDKGCKVSFSGILKFVREVREAVMQVDAFLSGKSLENAK